MCGGLARWLRLFGVDATFVPGIDDAELVRHALAEQRTVISSDHKLFERRVLASGQLAGIRLPVGLELDAQVRLVARRLGLRAGFPRCTRCNGELEAVGRAEVGDVVPARSLIWARQFFRCRCCGQVYWEGTHWRRIGRLRAELKP